MNNDPGLTACGRMGASPSNISSLALLLLVSCILELEHASGDLLLFDKRPVGS